MVFGRCIDVYEGVIPVVGSQIGPGGIAISEFEPQDAGRERHRVVHVGCSDPHVTDVVQLHHAVVPPSMA
jgi:hypothetical protein